LIKKIKEFEMINKRIMSVIFVLILIISSNANAIEYNRLYRGVRPMGMGGAFTAVADDENALYYNPAGLALNQTFHMGLFNPIAGLSKDTYDLINTDFDNFDDAAALEVFMRDFVGTYQHAQLGLFPYIGFTSDNVGIMMAGFANVQIGASVRNLADPYLDTRIFFDYGAYVGAGFNVAEDNSFKIGVAAKFITRKNVIEKFYSSQLSDDEFEDKLEDEYMKEGDGVSADIGFIYSMGDTFKLNIAAVAQNVPEMDMGDAEDIKTIVNAGFALITDLSFAKFTLAADFRDVAMNDGEDDDIGKRLHVGAEFRFNYLLAVRAGFNQGYYTLGATVDIWVIRIDAATYGEEVGAYAGQREDRRYLLQITIGW
jgi:hypothetical protein